MDALPALVTMESLAAARDGWNTPRPTSATLPGGNKRLRYFFDFKLPTEEIHPSAVQV